jgi:hypothetical protein
MTWYPGTSWMKRAKPSTGSPVTELQAYGELAQQPALHLLASATANDADHPAGLDRIAGDEDAPGGTSTKEQLTYRAGAPVASLCTLVTAAAISALRCARRPPAGTVN